jgi:hypothetical protein
MSAQQFLINCTTQHFAYASIWEWQLMQFDVFDAYLLLLFSINIFL